MYSNYCDRCGAHAMLRVTLQTDQELLFCGHHGHQNFEHFKNMNYETEWLSEDNVPHLASV